MNTCDNINVIDSVAKNTHSNENFGAIKKYSIEQYFKFPNDMADEHKIFCSDKLRIAKHLNISLFFF